MVLTLAQRALNAYATSTFTVAGKEIIVGGKKGTLQYLGLTVDAASIDAAAVGVDRQVTRGGYRRARWLGDSGGPNVQASTATVFSYPTTSGNARPGRPFRFVALTDTGGDSKGRKVSGSLELQGPWGHFIERMLGDRPPHSVRFWSPDGARMDQPVLSDADLD